MLNQKVMFLFARTPVHVGAGNSVGAVDAPVMRERHTDIPVIPGTSLKGVLSDLWNERGAEGKMVRSAVGVGLFGSDSKSESLSAGSLLIGEGRVLAFPVRSAKNAFAWITCPMVLKKFARNAGVSFDDIALPDAESCYASKELTLAGDSVVLEEYCLTCKGDAASVAEQLMSCTFSDDLWNTVKTRLAIVSDEMFSFFVRNACEVVTRIRINDDTKVVDNGALFNQEQVPSETLFYSVLGEQLVKGSSGGLDALEAKVKDVSVIQVGGDATVGLGFCQVFFKEVK